jgi:hypothetical protein
MARKQLQQSRASAAIRFDVAWPESNFNKAVRLLPYVERLNL